MVRLNSKDPSGMPMSPDGMGRPISPVMGSPLRQRGFYSEVLDNELGEELTVITNAAHCGPRDEATQPKLSGAKQKVVPVAQFADPTPIPQKKQQLAKRAPQATTPSRALEPKVLVPYHPGSGNTPRRIVIERQKRLFALQDLEQVCARPACHTPVTLAPGYAVSHERAAAPAASARPASARGACTRAPRPTPP
jgi:hypothetical protein